MSPYSLIDLVKITSKLNLLEKTSKIHRKDVVGK